MVKATERNETEVCGGGRAPGGICVWVEGMTSSPTGVPAHRQVPSAVCAASKRLSLCPTSVHGQGQRSEEGGARDEVGPGPPSDVRPFACPPCLRLRLFVFPNCPLETTSVGWSELAVCE